MFLRNFAAKFGALCAISSKTLLVNSRSIVLRLVNRNLENFTSKQDEHSGALTCIAWGCCITISFCLGIPEPLKRDVGLLQSCALFVCLCEQAPSQQRHQTTKGATTLNQHL